MHCKKTTPPSTAASAMPGINQATGLCVTGGSKSGYDQMRPFRTGQKKFWLYISRLSVLLYPGTHKFLQRWSAGDAISCADNVLSFLITVIATHAHTVSSYSRSHRLATDSSNHREGPALNRNSIYLHQSVFINSGNTGIKRAHENEDLILP